jgi:hypothetical protein
MANSSIFSGIGGFGSNVISPLDFMGGFGYALPWIPTVGAAGAPNEPRRATPIPKVTIDPDQDSPGHRRQVRARAEAEGRRDAQSGRPLLEEVPGDEGEAEHWTRVARRDAQIAEYQKIAADPDYEPDTWYIDHWDIHHWSEKIPPGVPIVAQAGTAGQAGVAQAGTQRPPWTGAATWSGELPSEALMRESAETPPEEEPFFDPLGLEGYEATRSSFPSWDDLFSSEYWSDVGRDFPTTGDAAAAAQTALGLGFSAPYMGLGTAAFSALASAAAKSRMNERIRSQFPELGPAETDFFGRTPGFDERDYATLAEHGRGVDLTGYAGALGRVDPALSTELGYNRSDIAHDQFAYDFAQEMAEHEATMADLSTLSTGELEDIAMSDPNVSQADRDAISHVAAWGLDRDIDPAIAHIEDVGMEPPPASLGSRALSLNALDKSRTPVTQKNLLRTEMGAAANPSVTGEWDFQTEPISFEPGTFANPELGEFIGDLSTVSWTDPNVAPAYQSLPGYISTAGMTHAEDLEKQKEINAALEHYMEVTLPKHSLPMQELMTVDPAAQAVADAQVAAMAAAKSEATKAAALQEEEHQFWSWYGEPEDYSDAPDPGDVGFGGEDSPW